MSFRIGVSSILFILKVRSFGLVSSTRQLCIVIGQVQQTSVPQKTLPSAVAIYVAVLGLAKQTKLSQSNIVLPNLNSVSIAYVSDLLACPLGIFIG